MATRTLSQVCERSSLFKWGVGAGGRGLTALALVLMASGCGQKVAPPPKTIAVSGQVTYQGQPLTKGTVTFQPLDSGRDAKLRPAIGTIGPDGKYVLSTFNPDDGVVPGAYTVVVSSYENEPTLEEYDQGVKRKSAIPEKYSNSLTSGLLKQIEETESGPVVYDIALP